MGKINNILVTGAAGFIGSHLCKNLLKKDFKVIGIDNLNDYYDPKLKEKRLQNINEVAKKENKSWEFIKEDLINYDNLLKIFKSFNPKVVINLAAQAGVRYSLENPHIYINSNVVGFLNILECCKEIKVKNLLYASSSSIYGGNIKVPFSENDPANHPVSIYAATKRTNELMAHTYSHLYKIPATGLRFFTVYGPWGRPDMAPMIFTDAIVKNREIEIYNYGDMARSFTYIDDVITILLKLIEKPAIADKNFNSCMPSPSSSWCSHKIFNIGNENSINLNDFIETLEKAIGKKAIRIYKKMQPGDVQNTLADSKLINEWVGEFPKTSLEIGIKNFVGWYKTFYNLQ